MRAQLNDAWSVHCNITNYYDRDYNKYIILYKKHYKSHKHRMIVEIDKQFHYF